MRKKLSAAAIDMLEQRIHANSAERSSTVFGIVDSDGQLIKCIERIGGDWVDSIRAPEIYTAEKLERAVTSEKRFVIVIGGRGSMKSVGVVDIMLAGVRDYGDKV